MPQDKDLLIDQEIGAARGLDLLILRLWVNLDFRCLESDPRMWNWRQPYLDLIFEKTA